MSYFGASSRMAGDPGFFGTLGRIGRGVAGVVTGGVSEQVISGIQAVRGGGGGSRPPVINPPFAGPPGAGIGALGIRVGVGEGLQMRNGSGNCPKGMQPAKVWVRGAGYQRVGHCVKIRRRNPFNPQAARRASGRLHSLGKGLGGIKKSVGKADRALNPKRGRSTPAGHRRKLTHA